AHRMTMRRLEIGIDFGQDAEGDPRPRRTIGTLAEDGPQLYFEYAAEFIASPSPLPLSPREMPVRAGIFKHHVRDFDYLPGLLADALPDGFGRLVQDRAFEAA